MLSVGALQWGWLDYPVALITVACIVTPAGMATRLVAVEWRAGRSQAESEERGEGLLGAEGSTAEGASADSSYDTTIITNPSSQDLAATNMPPSGAVAASDLSARASGLH